ncbi:MAG: peptide-methionine (S)-S-oxide reductase MsrA [Defluviitaleaceae bacterium]|nr:peptide-methionine (S)-S-oxide reductase MsrA [Defluviitaleaceae bacterium]
MLPKNPNEGLEFKQENLRTIYLAGGCFWGTDAFMERIYGVYSTRCGYANGHVLNPEYKEVKTGSTGHAETVILKYDITKTDLTTILHEFFKTINPTSLNRQGVDIGSQYRTGIYFVDKNDEPVITQFIKEKQKEYDDTIMVEVCELRCFYDAEEYHQKYLEKNPGGYCHVDLGLLPNE